ncbi:MAG: nucleotidyltransferase domain-containing protein [Nitrospirae bacterium]|nr:nucleotidyltransferase domain-containing protein [Nitrospirota bacterium]
MGMVAEETKSLLAEFRAELEKIYGARLVELLLYGSGARGEAGPDSDLDVVLVLKDLKTPSREIDRLADLLAEMNIRHGVLISVMPIDTESYKDATGPFWNNVRAEGVAA